MIVGQPSRLPFRGPAAISALPRSRLTHRSQCDGICVHLRYLRFLRAMVRWLENVMGFATFFEFLAIFAVRTAMCPLGFKTSAMALPDRFATDPSRRPLRPGLL